MVYWRRVPVGAALQVPNTMYQGEEIGRGPGREREKGEKGRARVSQSHDALPTRDWT